MPAISLPSIKTGLIALSVCCAAGLFAQSAPSPAAALLGRWEVLSYAEQGVPVDKKRDAAAQARAVYAQVREQRARNWYGYDAAWDELSRRESRAFQRWAEQDSTVETQRLAEAIRTPYFAVFFADSTLSLYNKVPATNEIRFPEKRHYVFSPATMSIDVWAPGADAPYGKWDVQIIRLEAERMTLFIPEEAEVVELVRASGTLP